MLELLGNLILLAILIAGCECFEAVVNADGTHK